MERISFTNYAGKTLHFNEFGPFYLLSIDPNGVTLSRDIKSAVNTHGAFTYEAIFNSKVIPVELGFKGVESGRWSEKKARLMWQEIAETFLLNRDGLLTYMTPVGNYEILCHPQEFNSYEQKGGQFGAVKLRLLSDEAFWREQIPQNYEIGQVSGGYRYPLRYPIQFGRWVKAADIFNSQSIEIPLVVSVRSSAPYIKLINEATGQFLQVNRQLKSNEKMVIDTGQCTVEVFTLNQYGDVLSREYADQRLTIESEFFKLRPGTNRIRIENGAAHTEAPATIVFQIPRPVV